MTLYKLAMEIQNQNQKSKRSYTPEERASRIAYASKYYQNNKIKLNEINRAYAILHPEDKRLTTKKSANRIVICNACNQKMTADVFSKHKNSIKHNNNILNFNNNVPIMVVTN